MLKEQIYDLLKGKPEYEVLELSKLQQVINEHPYFSPIHSLLIKKNAGEIDPKQLELAAIKANNRSRFKKFLNHAENVIQTSPVVENDTIEDSLQDIIDEEQNTFDRQSESVEIEDSNIESDDEVVNGDNTDQIEIEDSSNALDDELANNDIDNQSEIEEKEVEEEKNQSKIVTAAGIGASVVAGEVMLANENETDEQVIEPEADDTEELDNDLQTANVMEAEEVEEILEDDAPLYEIEDTIKVTDEIDLKNNENALNETEDKNFEIADSAIEENIAASNQNFKDEVELLHDIDEETNIELDNDFAFDSNEQETEIELAIEESTLVSDEENEDMFACAADEGEQEIEADAYILESEVNESSFESIAEDELTRSKLLAKIGNALPNQADDLTLIGGISADTQEALNKNGIYTFLQLKNASNSESRTYLAELLADDSVENNNWSEQAGEHYVTKYQKILLEKVGNSNYDQADNLKDLNGVGPVLEKKLNEAGFFNFAQIAKLDNKDIDVLTELLGYFPGRIERDDWIGQANRKIELKQRMLAAEKAKNEDSSFSLNSSNATKETIDPALEELRNKIKARKELKEEDAIAELEEEIKIENENEIEESFKEPLIAETKTENPFYFEEEDAEEAIEQPTNEHKEIEVELNEIDEIESEVSEKLTDETTEEDDDSLSFTSWLTKLDKGKEEEESKKKAQIINESEDKNPSLVKVDKDNVDQIKAFTGKEPELIEVESVTEIRETANKSLAEEKLMVSETLAKIYEEQEYYKKAIKTYEKLSLKYPEKSIYFAGRIADLKKK